MWVVTVVEVVGWVRRITDGVLQTKYLGFSASAWNAATSYDGPDQAARGAHACANKPQAVSGRPAAGGAHHQPRQTLRRALCPYARNETSSVVATIPAALSPPSDDAVRHALSAAPRPRLDQFHFRRLAANVYSHARLDVSFVRRDLRSSSTRDATYSNSYCILTFLSYSNQRPPRNTTRSWTRWDQLQARSSP